jgi:glycosidase
LHGWAADAVFYHVYPLGLCGAPATNDFSSEPVERLAKLTGWLAHIRDLGCNALLLGPVFESSAHGYDTADYWHVDRRLGTDETLRSLVESCHAAGLRVVLDGVFNHVGRDFWAFRDVLAKGPASPFAGWFAGLSFEGRSPYGDRFSYEGWAGHFDLVKLNLAHPEVRAHLLDAVRSWILDFDIDGLRLDAADSVNLGFLRELSAWCRSIQPDFWLVGEVVHGDYRRWANAETLDSVTNYEAYKGLWSSLADHNYFEIAHSLEREFGSGGLYEGLALYNFVDNHDQDRVAGKLGETRLLYPLYLLLFTMPGIPSIYYGSEWGLQAKRLPGDDGPVRPALSLEDGPSLGCAPDLAAAIGRLASVRDGSAALRVGSYRELHVASEQFAFARELDAETVVVLLNAAATAAQLTVPTPFDGDWRDLLNGGTVRSSGGNLRVDVPPFWGCVLAR